MRVGVVTELKSDEYRVALTPAGARELVERGHEVLVEAGAGDGSAFPDTAYVGRRRTARDARGRLGDRRPRPQGQGAAAGGVRPRFARISCLFTYLHLAADEGSTRALVASGATCIAYETVRDRATGALPLLAPMSEVAGRLATADGRLGAREVAGRARDPPRRGARRAAGAW